MSETTSTFGARFAEATGIDERLALEAAEAKRAPFADADSLLNTLIAHALAGDAVARVKPAKRKTDDDTVELLVNLSDAERAALATSFEVAEQEKRGSWYVPEGEPLSVGLMHVVRWVNANPRLVVTPAESEKVTPTFRGAPHTVALWALEPLFETLFLPLKLRGSRWLGKRTVEQQEKSWQLVDPLYEALGISGPELDRFRLGTGWSTHDLETVIAIRKALVERWSAVCTVAGERYRAFRVGELVDRYYAKAKNGQAQRSQVLTKALGRTLTAYFAGDWLAFLDYLGEQVHPGEQLIAALPETKFMVGGASRAAEVAAEHGLPEDEVNRMLSAFWEQSEPRSPVERRVEALKRYWREFDALHAQQESGMTSLWGLVENNGPNIRPRASGDGAEPPEGEGDSEPFTPRLYERVLSPELNAEVAELWDSTMLPRWPDRIVTQPAPHSEVAAILGPALRFWEGAGLTTWFLCEGPYSRTDIDGFPNHYERELHALSELGCPVGGELFRELREAQERHGAPAHATGGVALTVTISLSPEGVVMSDDPEEDGQPHVSFEVLRDIVTKHRRAWAEKYFDQYLRSCWELELRAAAEAYHRRVAEKNRQPTLKQFAKPAARATNQWFGGDITGLYRALGLKAPDPAIKAERLVPRDPDGFATNLFAQLAGEPYRRPPMWHEAPEEHERLSNFSDLAGLCVEYLQLEEALGQAPELKNLGRAKFQYHSSVLAEDLDEAWGIYSAAVHDVLRAVRESPSPPPGWYEDPAEKAPRRWWDGARWTEHVSH